MLKHPQGRQVQRQSLLISKPLRECLTDSAGILISDSLARCNWHEAVDPHHMPLAPKPDEVVEVLVQVNINKGQIRFQDHGQ